MICRSVLIPLSFLWTLLSRTRVAISVIWRLLLLLQPKIMILLFPLRGVPEDEADEVRELLTARNIDFYETTAGNWGMSMPGLWLRDAVDLEVARDIINAYQQERVRHSREDYLQRKQKGLHQTFISAFIGQPVRYSMYIFAMGLVVYVSIKLVFELGL